MTELTRAKIPDHLRKYVVEQNYARYSPEDQAVWRYIMRQLIGYLSVHAHPIYLEGLRKSGISSERIPLITDVDKHLNDFDWGAVPVSGFIPPAAFMEFQAIGVLPIASDMRTLDHLLYTPAPDIVHEAAGHAPILAQPEYAAYLRQYGEVARHSILSKEDMDQYEAIRILSDLKENPDSTAAQIQDTEKRLNEINENMSFVSEAALLGRMNWWTAEYGLVGDLKNPKIFGAGLLSSVGEARACLDAKVRKIPLSVDCVDFAYDITEPQPQLFVTRDFGQLSEVLEHLAVRMAYRKGGTVGLERAQQARTVNSVELNSGLQISGVLESFQVTDSAAGIPIFLKFSGPCQLAAGYRELPGQGTRRHAHGFSSPIGYLRNGSRCLSTYNESELANLGLRLGQRCRLEFDSGIKLDGVLKDQFFQEGRLLTLTWTDCRVSLGDRVLFNPEWGEFDMAVGTTVKSVFGGPADRSKFSEQNDFVAKTVPPRKPSVLEQNRHALFKRNHSLRDNAGASDLPAAIQEFLRDETSPWLVGMELYELAVRHGLPASELEKLKSKLNMAGSKSPSIEQCVRDGLAIADRSP